MSQIVVPSTVVDALPAGANPVSLWFDTSAGVTTEALATLTIQKGDAASTTAATYAPTAGKTFRVVSILLGGASSSTALIGVKFRVRSLVSGTVTATGPVRFYARLLIPASAAANGSGVAPMFFVGGATGLIDIPSGGSIGVSHVAGATTYSADITIQGYEF